MGNYSSKLFNNNTDNDTKIKEQDQHPEKIKIDSGAVVQNDQKSEQVLDNIGIVQTPINKKYVLEPRKRTNAIPEYLQTENTRKPYLETDLDYVSANQKYWLDPRSPNVAFPRTPILLHNELDSSKKNMNNESLSKLKLSLEEMQSNEVDLDPRSPASNFDRTPISTVKVSKQFDSQGQTSRLRKSNSSLDICIKLSYCETTNLFNVPEIQALPDIVVSLRRSCSMKDNLNKKSPSVNDNVDVKSELMSDDLHSIKLHVSSENSTPNREGKNESVKDDCPENDIIKTSEKSLEVKDSNTIFENNVDERDINNLNKVTDSEEKFKIWRDSYSNLPESSVNSHLNNSRKNSSIHDKEEILIEFDDCSVINSVENNHLKKIENAEGSTKEKKIKSTEKKNFEIRREKRLLDDQKVFSPEVKTASDILKNRTPFSNRSNSNGQIHALSAKSPLPFLGHRKLLLGENKNLQENTPPPQKKLIKNVPKKLNGTQWDSDTTIII